MARKKKPEEHENLERWLVSYADFITLLFAFFVVMYAISSLNEGKYRVLSDSLIKAFRQATVSHKPIPMGMVPSTQGNTQSSPNPIAVHKESSPHKTQSVIKAEKRRTDAGVLRSRNMRQIKTAIQKNMKSMIKERFISMREGQFWLEVEIDSKILFNSGSAEIAGQSVGALQKLAAILRDYSNPIQVEGFTDSLPIDSDIYPSNWELSAARAASVVHLFTDEGVAPRRMAAVGYGEHRPIADNSTIEGRLKNRRVVLVIMANDKEKHAVDIDRRNSPAPSAAPTADVR